jgi:hypothetical protein
LVESDDCGTDYQISHGSSAIEQEIQFEVDRDRIAVME